jgi:hypothetical protein
MSLSIKIWTILVDNDVFSTLLVNEGKLKKMCFSISEWRLKTLLIIRDLT